MARSYVATNVWLTASSVLETLGRVLRRARRLLSHVLLQNDDSSRHGNDDRYDPAFGFPRARFRRHASRITRHGLLHVAVHHDDRALGRLPELDSRYDSRHPFERRASACRRIVFVMFVVFVHVTGVSSICVFVRAFVI